MLSLNTSNTLVKATLVTERVWHCQLQTPHLPACRLPPLPCFQAPPEPKVEIEGVVCLPVTNGIKCLRGVCNERLKYEVEYSLKKGTSENSYLLSVSSVRHTHGPQLACGTPFHLPSAINNQHNLI